MKKYEIWVGYYHLGQGFDPPLHPEKLAEIEAIDFKTACFKYELQSMLSVVEMAEKENRPLSDQSYEWWYNPHDNSNGWLGPYFETMEEAARTFLI